MLRVLVHQLVKELKLEASWAPMMGGFFPEESTRNNFEISRTKDCFLGKLVVHPSCPHWSLALALRALPG